MLQTYIYLDQWDHYLVVSLILQNMQLASIALNRNAVGLLPRRFPTRRITGLVQISVATKTRSLMPPVSRHCNHFLMTPDIQLIKRPNPSSPLSCHPSRFTSASEALVKRDGWQLKGEDGLGFLMRCISWVIRK